MQAALLAYKIVWLAGLYWLIVLAGKFFTREPLLYHYSYGNYTQETVPVLVVLGIQILSLAYQLLTRTLRGKSADSLVLHVLSPKIAGVSTVLFLLWASSGPAPGSSYLPLGALTLVSMLGAIAVRKGPMSRDSERIRATTSANAASSGSVARFVTPTRTFADLFGNRELKERLLLAAGEVVRPGKKSPGDHARNGILLHGPAGVGKTVIVEALAGELRLPLLVLTPADIASPWVGEKTSRVRAAFQEALRRQPCLLFLDELDSFLETRDAAGPGATKEDRDLVNALLTLMVDVRQARVLLVAATNYLSRLDSAAIREGRFDFKIEVPLPDKEARVGLLLSGLRSHLPGARVPADLVESVAARWNGYSTKRILAITEEIPSVMRRQGRSSPEFEDFMLALRAVQGHAVNRLENVRPLRELVLSDRTRRSLDNLQARMADPERTERSGGTLPTGVLMFGPPGTGKTATAKALAKELGWTFLATSGTDLARDAAALDAIFAKALDLRPTLIFIDEADDLLRDRVYSGSAAAANKLLTLMDGASDSARDVVWVAATNHPEHADPALLRGGRFSEKIIFELPAFEALLEHVRQWLRLRSVQLEPSFDVEGLTELLGEVSIANAEAVLQSAVNQAIGRRAPLVLVSRQDVLHAIELVLG